MLLLARFCADSFSSISLGTVNQGVSYSLRARCNILSYDCLQFEYKCSIPHLVLVLYILLHCWYTLFPNGYRIESITSPEVQGKYGSLQRKQINLVDFDGVTSKFLLWGEQVLLANVFRYDTICIPFNLFVFVCFSLFPASVPGCNFVLFSVGSTLALDRPFILSSTESALELSEEFCLEYGTATQLYLVPFIRHEEQVSPEWLSLRDDNSYYYLET